MPIDHFANCLDSTMCGTDSLVAKRCQRLGGCFDICQETTLCITEQCH